MPVLAHTSPLEKSAVGLGMLPEEAVIVVEEGPDEKEEEEEDNDEEEDIEDSPEDKEVVEVAVEERVVAAGVGVSISLELSVGTAVEVVSGVASVLEDRVGVAVGVGSSVERIIVALEGAGDAVMATGNVLADGSVTKKLKLPIPLRVIFWLSIPLDPDKHLMKRRTLRGGE